LTEKIFGGAVVKIGENDGEGQEKMEWILESRLNGEDWQDVERLRRGMKLV
jgi:hypothetical protein